MCSYLGKMFWEALIKNKSKQKSFSTTVSHSLPSNPESILSLDNLGKLLKYYNILAYLRGGNWVTLFSFYVFFENFMHIYNKL